MTDLYDEWFIYETWTFEEAAYLFNGQDPTKREKEPLSDIGTRRNIPFYKSLADLHKLKLSPREQKVFKTYHIFLRVDWKRYVDSKVDPNFWYKKEASPSVFMCLAEDKQIKIPSELKEKWEKINLPGKEKELYQGLTINDKRLLVLKDWLAKNNKSGSATLEITRYELWNELSGIDKSTFPPKSEHTINGFFKSQKYCTFKIGRRKGGN